jgi:YtcA family
VNARPRIELSVGLLGPSVLAGCNPVISPVVSVAGANFPVWTLCLLVGATSALSLRPLFVAIGLDQWMAPRSLVYSCFALVVAFLCWLVVGR